MKRSILILFLLFTSVCGSVMMAQSPAYRGFIDTGYSFGIGARSASKWVLSTAHGAEFIPGKLFVGGGVGLGISTESNHEVYNMPVFANARYTFSDLKVAPFIDMKAGYGFLWDKNHPGGNEGGFYFAPTAGISLPVGGDVRVNFGVTYTLQRACYTTKDHGNTHRHTCDDGGFGLLMGVEF